MVFSFSVETLGSLPVVVRWFSSLSCLGNEAREAETHWQSRMSSFSALSQQHMVALQTLESVAWENERLRSSLSALSASKAESVRELRLIASELDAAKEELKTERATGEALRETERAKGEAAIKEREVKHQVEVADLKDEHQRQLQLLKRANKDDMASNEVCCWSCSLF